jgi:hypothetical protein
MKTNHKADIKLIETAHKLAVDIERALGEGN